MRLITPTCPQKKKEVGIEPKSCGACFAEEKTANDACAGTSTQQLACLAANARARAQCQETCKLP